ncbi:MAG: aminotransferase class I/II-fold pyridoxal phosphate-dependent enzyme [Oscillospiraceae bacterium]|jgi:threonine aldolase|nr:aminotransferase class I/II-fold pyridoxal phosphate-dependent enzyme [Oscillospiraceae bacterium]
MPQNIKKIRFENDYSEGAHPAVLSRIQEANLVQRAGYGLDDACLAAADSIRSRVGRQDADVHFLTGGTSANLIALTAFLRPHEAVICTDTAHIHVHETGAIEAAGHKLITLSAPDGKLSPAPIEEAALRFTDEHMVKPRLVFIANATELGTHYTLSELRSLRAVCDKLGLLLYMDGARLGNALAASDAEWADLPNLLDAFYIGGTKNGALFGEAMVIVNDRLKPYFRYVIKQRGGMMAKGFLLGLQFQALFENDLYMEMARHANAMADELRAALAEKRIPLSPATKTNQVFAVMPNGMIRTLSKRYAFHAMQPIDEQHTVVRLVASWATTREMVSAFRNDLIKI